MKNDKFEDDRKQIIEIKKPEKKEEEIKIADFKGFITIKLRENHLPNKKNIEAPKKSKKIDDSD